MFKSTKVSVGSSKPRYVKPTKKELAQLTNAARVSDQPFGNILGTKKKAKKKRYGYSQFANDLNQYQGLGPDSFSSFGHSYDSGGHLGRNLNIRI